MKTIYWQTSKYNPLMKKSIFFPWLQSLNHMGVGSAKNNFTYSEKMHSDWFKLTM